MFDLSNYSSYSRWMPYGEINKKHLYIYQIIPFIKKSGNIKFLITVKMQRGNFALRINTLFPRLHLMFQFRQIFEMKNFFFWISLVISYSMKMLSEVEPYTTTAESAKVFCNRKVYFIPPLQIGLLYFHMHVL